MPQEPEAFECSAILQHETKMAVLFLRDGNPEDTLWIPKSQLDGVTYCDSELEPGASEYILGEWVSHIFVPPWFAEKEGIDE